MDPEEWKSFKTEQIRWGFRGFSGRVMGCVLLFGTLLRSPGGASVIRPCAASKQVLLLGGGVDLPPQSQGVGVRSPRPSHIPRVFAHLRCSFSPQGVCVSLDPTQILRCEGFPPQVYFRQMCIFLRPRGAGCCHATPRPPPRRPSHPIPSPTIPRSVRQAACRPPRGPSVAADGPGIQGFGPQGPCQPFLGIYTAKE